MDKILDLAVAAAKNATKGIKADYHEVSRELEHDVKIVADREMEKIIIETISKTSEYPILSEESGEINIKKSEYLWIIDPLDGSLNFSRGIPICCVSISLWKNELPLLGVIYDFNRNDMFIGIVGKGASLNGKLIKVGSIKEKNRAVICTGFPAATNFAEGALSSFVKKLSDYKKVRLIGSAALSLAYVACGRADVYQENDIKVWDVAAGLALVKAAGGEVKYTKTFLKNTFSVKAANKDLIGKLC